MVKKNSKSSPKKESLVQSKISEVEKKPELVYSPHDLWRLEEYKKTYIDSLNLTNKDLKKVGVHLHTCIGTLTSLVKSGRELKIIGNKNGKAYIAIGIDPEKKKIVQLRGRYNNVPGGRELEMYRQLCKEIGIEK